MKYPVIYCFVCFIFWSCKDNAIQIADDPINAYSTDTSPVFTEKNNYKTRFKNDTTFVAKGFDFPVGKPNAKGYYNAQKFQENNHLGDDWNGENGGNTDFGDPIYSIANGYISEVKDYKGGWGKVIRIVHLHNKKLYKSIYAHCDSILVNSNRFIKKGEKIATIGNCNGAYFAHLHLEIRNKVDLDIGSGYSTDTTGYLNPTNFINKNRN
ncbi:M23 family metallopeptidase [Winogradskyella litoriviva]|uniref:M23 family metallopeptidase n=1 Tax=Winogradskyella litoriviva TaxID=1220182 RepID=A0ABX2E4T8_9FLAO|nr:M23 family metallopeptidase [Winogradskyella litoriviva]NRD23427.1 M23 family metallopeptidase [Winogradskyella litoriviva]